VAGGGCAGRTPRTLHVSSLPRTREPSHRLTKAAWIPAFAGMTTEKTSAPPKAGAAAWGVQPRRRRWAYRKARDPRRTGAYPEGT
jgi:hypothetical protein